MLWGINKYLFLEKKMTVAQYVRAIENFNVPLKLPDPLVEEKFKQFMKFAVDTKNHELIACQAVSVKKYVETKDYEEFLRDFNLMKDYIQTCLNESFNKITDHYEQLDAFWQMLEAEYPDLFNHEAFHMANMEKIRENMMVCKEACFNKKMEILELVDFGKVLDAHQLNSILNQQYKVPFYFINQLDIFFKASVNLLDDPTFIELLIKFFS